jgi:TRAP-type C4-dicarboxylate transport system permease small subunit
MTYVYAVMPICAAMMAWYALVDIIELLINGETSQPQEESL